MGRPVGGSRAFVALGGNLGNVLRTFGTALRDMTRADMRVTAVSSAYRTEPERLSGADESGPTEDMRREILSNLEEGKIDYEEALNLLKESEAK